jgi:hypothetical protein
VEEEERQVEEKRRDNLERHIINLVMELVKHKIEKHQDKRIHPCSTCDMSFKSLPVLYKHKSRQHSFKFCVCMKAVERLSRLQSELVH